MIWLFLIGLFLGKIECERFESGVGENECVLMFSLFGDGVERFGFEGGVRYGDTFCVRDKCFVGEFFLGIFVGVEWGCLYLVCLLFMFNVVNFLKVFIFKYSCMSCSSSFVKSYVFGNSFLRGFYFGVDFKMFNMCFLSVFL